MCVKASTRKRTMGCGKSRPHSPNDSEADLKNSGGHGYTKNSAGLSSKHSRKLFSGDDKKHQDRAGEKDGTETSSAGRKVSNGRTRVKDRDEEIGIPLNSSSPSSRTAGAAAVATASGPVEELPDKSNGASKSNNKNYLLEVPNEISKIETTTTRSSHKDFKTITTTKTVHITTSQLEFFKMLDEKIEKGGDYHTSNEASEVSSIDDAYRQ